jgi:hypothetical protein
LRPSRGITDENVKPPGFLDGQINGAAAVLPIANIGVDSRGRAPLLGNLSGHLITAFLKFIQDQHMLYAFLNESVNGSASVTAATAGNECGFSIQATHTTLL